jgi:hypothetical protein
MHTIFIDNEPARTAQEVADAVHSAPETVRIESGPEIDPGVYDGPLLDLPPDSHILFSLRNGVIGQIHVNHELVRTVEVMRKTV